MNKKIAVGYTLFLEHILPYSVKEEKGKMPEPPRLQLGGGAWNIAKTMESLGQGRRAPTVFACTAEEESSHSAALASILAHEKIPVTLLPLQARVSSSYYLTPSGGKTWAFGDRGGNIVLPSSLHRKKISSGAKSADIKILAETGGEKAEVLLGAMLAKKYRRSQISVLIPSRALLRSRYLSEIMPHMDMLSLNEEEALILRGKPLRIQDMVQIKMPFVFVTRGAKGAWLKAYEKVYEAGVVPIKNPKFIGGAGDAATAALVWKLFAENADPQEALQFAMKIGRATLLKPTSYYTS